ncbi:acyl-CoA dehydrogenase family protein [Kitasatospora sp. GAS204B]|uniref:acyl-CoA dehydrogenase family protein n=1 Tax=unclassified Kitasatospora TaxID=2633591 RepID=UPI0024750E49|nr:acyl-CoA dehydrogenase family protein [Kitasatospora sp. GAS204B]MDH6118960.1 alkylation response protein AidB-like acyl-CoA dehydrogenase [Kitasatospora sp. GAS204B]
MFGPEDHALRNKVLEFARALSAESDEKARDGFDRVGWKRLAEFGVHGWIAPVEYGGAGLDPLSAILAFEALGQGCTDNGLVFAVNNHVWACMVYLMEHGTPAQKGRWLPGLVDGSLIGAHALTEAEAGSDMLSITTSARRDGDDWVIDGAKCFISNGPCADLFIVFARTGSTAGGQSALSAFVVPSTTPGLRVVRRIEKAGLEGCLMGELSFQECRVPADALLGAEGAGYQIFTATMDWERGFMCASQVGVLARLLEGSVARSAARRQFGRPIGHHQAVSHRIADMGVRLELARLLLYKVGELKREGRLAMLESSMLKLFVSESLVQSALDTAQLHGALGYTKDLGIEHEVRDAFGTTVYGGTSEIQRDIIARLLGVPGRP